MFWPQHHDIAADPDSDYLNSGTDIEILCRCICQMRDVPLPMQHLYIMVVFSSQYSPSVWTVMGLERCSVHSLNGMQSKTLTYFCLPATRNGSRIASTHISNKLAFLRGMLVGMRMRLSGMVTKGLNRAIVASFPTVNVLTVGFVFHSSFGNTMFCSVINQG